MRTFAGVLRRNPGIEIVAVRRRIDADQSAFIEGGDFAGTHDDRLFVGQDLGTTRLCGNGRAVGPYLDPVTAGAGKADASARRADLQIVGLVAVADGHRQGAAGQQ